MPSKEVSAMNLKYINSFAEQILQSKLLLEEDMDLFLENFDWITFNSGGNKEIDVNLGATCKILTTLRCDPLVTVVIATPIVLYRYLRLLKDKYLERLHQKNMQQLISGLQALYKLNRRIISYLKMRNTSVAAIQPCARQCFEQIIAAEIHVVRHLMDQIQKMSNMLQPDTILPEVWDILDLRLNCFDSYEALTNNFQNLVDICVLIMSKFLGSLGLCLCVKLWDLNCDVLASLIDDAVPNCKAAVWTCVRGTTRDFDAIRCKLSYLDDVKKERQICRNITGLGRKIDQPLSKFMVSLQVTFELAQEVSKQLNECDGENDLEDVAQRLVNLQEQFTACSVSFESFMKVCGIVIKNTIDHMKKSDTTQALSSKAENNDLVKASHSIRYDDEIEAQDEEFDAYVPAIDETDTSSLTDDFEDSFSADFLLPVMLQELKEILKERRAIIAARQGKQVEEDVTEAIIDKKLSRHGSSGFKRKQSPLVSTPMSKFAFETVDDRETPDDTLKHATILTQLLKIPVAKRAGNEAVFGDDIGDTDSSEDNS